MWYTLENLAESVDLVYFRVMEENEMTDDYLGPITNDGDERKDSPEETPLVSPIFTSTEELVKTSEAKNDNTAPATSFSSTIEEIIEKPEEIVEVKPAYVEDPFSPKPVELTFDVDPTKSVPAPSISAQPPIGPQPSMQHIAPPVAAPRPPVASAPTPPITSQPAPVAPKVVAPSTPAYQPAPTQPVAATQYEAPSLQAPVQNSQPNIGNAPQAAPTTYQAPPYNGTPQQPQPGYGAPQSPQPGYGAPQPGYNQGTPQQPVGYPGMDPRILADVKQRNSKAFGLGIAAVICAGINVFIWNLILPVLAIILGAVGYSSLPKGQYPNGAPMAEKRSKILSMIGIIAGIAEIVIFVLIVIFFVFSDSYYYY